MMTRVAKSVSRDVHQAGLFHLSGVGACVKSGAVDKTDWADDSGTNVSSSSG